jgi:DNA-binding PadR family transcriptional regulator
MSDFDQKWERNWRRMEAMARDGFRKFGDNVNMSLDGVGGNFRIGRMLASGDLRLVALYLIEQQPRHGYDLIKAIEDSSHGFYSPSPGIVYPALTFLEEAGYVTSATEGNKKLYTITDEGRAHLADNREAIESTLSFLNKAGSRMRDWQDRMQSGTWPFSEEQAEKFRDMQRDGWPFSKPDHGPTPADEGPEARGHRGPGAFHWGPPPHPRGGPDELPPDVRDARKDLKRAVKGAVGNGPEVDARIAEILRRAAAEIRAVNGGKPVDTDSERG